MVKLGVMHYVCKHSFWTCLNKFKCSPTVYNEEKVFFTTFFSKLCIKLFFSLIKTHKAPINLQLELSSVILLLKDGLTELFLELIFHYQ